MNIFNLFLFLLSTSTYASSSHFFPLQIRLWLIFNSDQLYPAMTSRKVMTCIWNVTFKRTRNSKNFHGCTMWVSLVVKFKIFKETSKFFSCLTWVMCQSSQHLTKKHERCNVWKWFDDYTTFDMKCENKTNENFLPSEKLSSLMLNLEKRNSQVSSYFRSCWILFRSLSWTRAALHLSIAQQRDDDVKRAEALNFWKFYTFFLCHQN